MICVHHNKDLDGFASGAIIKRKFPTCKLIGWDYNDPIPWKQLPAGETIILIDISFPMADLIALSKDTDLTVIDHHISLKKQYDDFVKLNGGVYPEFNYIYKESTAACEIAWTYYFPGDFMPLAIRLLGMYDTWRQNEPGFSWDDVILPFQYYARLECTSAETFPELWYHMTNIEIPISAGRAILKYQGQVDEATCRDGSFEKTLAGLNAICLNCWKFNSNMLKSVYRPEKHDIMVGISYTGRNWIVSLRSDKPEIDVSVIAKSRGGGGHKAAAGFQCDTLEQIWEVSEPAKLVEMKSRSL